MKKKTAHLQQIYTVFTEKTKAYKTAQACQRGCAFCCSRAGSIDITTLEGLAIQETLNAFPKTRRKALVKTLHQEIRKRERKKIVPCPFLMKNNACMIYEVRPFSCRRIYSDHVCTSREPPRVSRQVMEIAAQTIRELQQLDHTGYSGHISYILHMLATPAFINTYLNGDFKPQEIMVFGKSHNIIINQMMA